MGAAQSYQLVNTTWVAPGRGASPYQRPQQVVVNGTTYPTVRYEDLYVSGDSVSAAMSRLATPAVITFPVGDFFADDFGTGFLTAINVDNTKPIKGIWGSGPGDYSHTADGTYFGINPGTSTKSAQQNSIPYVMKAADCGAQSYGQFAVLGTEQGHLYSCFSIYHPTGPCTVTDVLVAGWAGNANVPPGEMAGFTIIEPDAGPHYSHTITRLEGDGRRPDGVRYGSAPVGGQGLDGTTFTECYGHHCTASQFGFFKCRNITTYDCVSEYNGTGSAGLSGQGFNHEQTDGIVHYRPRILVDHSNGNTGVHVTHSNYGGTSAFAPGNLTIIDPVFNNIQGFTAGTFYINSWSPFDANNTTQPVVTLNGNPVTVQWGHA